MPQLRSTIALVGTAQAGGAINGNNVTLTFSPRPGKGDVIVVAGGHGAGTNGTLGPASGYTQLVSDTTTACKFYVGYRISDGSETNVVCQGGGSNSDAVDYVAFVFRGVDNVSVTDATTTTATGSSTNPNCPSITTATDGAVVLAFASSVVQDTAPGTVSGYSTPVSAANTDTNPFTTAGCFITKTTAGAEDPAAYSAWLTGVWFAASVALKPSITPAAQNGQMITDRPVLAIPPLAPSITQRSPYALDLTLPIGVKVQLTDLPAQRIGVSQTIAWRNKLTLDAAPAATDMPGQVTEWGTRQVIYSQPDVYQNRLPLTAVSYMPSRVVGWGTPDGPTPLNVSIASQLPKALITQGSPFNQYSWPLTPGPVPLSFSFSSQLSKALVTFVGPINQYSWPLTPGPAPLSFSFFSQLPKALVTFVGPINQYSWPLTPAAQPSINLRTWAEKYNPNLVGKDVVPGKSYLDRPNTITWYQSFTLSLQQSTLAPTAPSDTNMPGQVTEWGIRSPAYSQPDVVYQNRLPLGVTAAAYMPSRVVNWGTPEAPKVPPPTITFSNPTLLLGVTDVFRSPAYHRHWQFAPFDRPVRMGADIELLSSVEFVFGAPLYHRQWQFAPFDKPVRMGADIRLLTLPVLYPKNQYDWPIPRAPQRAADLGTWTRSYNANLIGKDVVPGEMYTDRPPVPPFYRTHTYWDIKLLAAPNPKPFAQTDWPLTPAAQFANNLKTWTAQYNPNLIGKDVVSGKAFTDRPPVPPFYRSHLYWDIKLLAAPVIKPFVQTDWPLTPAAKFANNLKTWTAQYNPNLIGKDQLPSGETFTDRPPVPPFYRSSEQNLLQRTLAPYPVGESLYDLPPRGYIYHHQLRSWTWSYNLNLIGKDRLPAGDIYDVRPPVPPWYRHWSINLLESTIAPEVPALPRNQYDWPLPSNLIPWVLQQRTFLGFVKIPEPTPPRGPTRTRAQSWDRRPGPDRDRRPGPDRDRRPANMSDRNH